MQKLIAELTRLYLQPGMLAPEALAEHVAGRQTLSLSLASEAGLTRGVMVPFSRQARDGEGAHWARLCDVANALQVELGFPAPAVSISGASSYGLWLSFATPTPAAQVQALLEAFFATHFPEFELAADAVRTIVELPPCVHAASGKWAAFIHPGMGASFADEPGLEMAPPLAGQVAFLEGLQRIGDEQFAKAVARLLQERVPAQAVPAPAAPAVAAPAARAAEPPCKEGLLLKDATLEDIVRHLHALNIEPTFRHLLPR